MAQTAWVSPRSDVKFHPLTTGGVLSGGGAHRIWILNDTSALLWHALNGARSLEELAGCVRAAFPVGEERALRDTRAALASFEREGLLAGGRPVAASEHDDRWDITADGPELVEPKRWAVAGSFRVANHAFEFRCMDVGLGEAFTRLMAHLQGEGEEPSDTQLAVLSGQADGRSWDLYLNGLRFKAGLARNRVLPHLATVLFVRCCETLKERLLFHAAVVEKGGRAVLFPGEAGSGKTTLAAVLMAHGYRVLSDELAVLNPDTLAVSSLPLPMSIKSRSVEPLSRHYPGLAEHAVHSRADGKDVRYLSPWSREPAGIGDRSAEVALIVFPRHRTGAQNRLTALDEAEALQRLAKTGSSNRDLTHSDVSAMVSLVKCHPCCELVYADVGEAVALLQERLLARYLKPA